MEYREDIPICCVNLESFSLKPLIYGKLLESQLPIIIRVRLVRLKLFQDFGIWYLVIQLLQLKTVSVILLF